MKNWFAVTVTGHVDKYGVDMTRRVAVESCCAWTADTMQTAIAELTQHDNGISDTRIADFQTITEPEHREARKQFDKVINLDRLLGI